jgi:hypothetical protein
VDCRFSRGSRRGTAGWLTLVPKACAFNRDITRGRVNLSRVFARKRQLGIHSASIFFLPHIDYDLLFVFLFVLLSYLIFFYTNQA